MTSDNPPAANGTKPASRRVPVRPGFTLIELVVSITVATIISGIAGTLLWNASKQQTEVSARGELIDVGGAALDAMVRYIREIPQDSGLSGLAQIDVAAQSELQFDLIGFRRNSADSTLEMTIDGGTWHVLAREVSSLTFSYFNRTGTQLSSFGGSSPFTLSQTDRESIRRVRINITLSRAGQSQSLRTGIFLRSFMDEVGSDPS